MNKYVALRKILQGIVLLLISTTLLFVVFRLMHGNLAQLISFSLGPGRDDGLDLHRLLIKFGLENGKWS